MRCQLRLLESHPMRLALEADEDDRGPSQADAMLVEHLPKQLREDKLTIKD